ncbi:MAG TPA: UDP-3-O-acyl-N-acetylglucosamine deacetylase [Kiloniellales bacterium]|nr:UDP-3-O-acyl-N-acetylglucosamine deacetylase [Kiloniellales bacterium]
MMGSTNGTRTRLQTQKTLKNAIHCSGVGLHSGVKIGMTLHPAAPDSGIVFRRSDLAGAPEIRAVWENAVETPLCTSLGRDDEVLVGSIEHLMSALAGCGVDNVIAELNGPEVPVMDGSAAPFVFLMECAGTRAQDAPRRALEIRKPVSIGDPQRNIVLAPGPGFGIEFEIDFDKSAVSRQRWSLQMAQDSYKREVARARTFGFLDEVDKLREMGLARGGSLDNAVVIGDERILNDGGLRYDNEFVRHKVLDLIGDLYLAGAPIIGQVKAMRSGHSMTVRLLRALFADREAWSWCEMPAMDDGAMQGASTPPRRAVAIPAA